MRSLISLAIALCVYVAILVLSRPVRAGERLPQCTLPGQSGKCPQCTLPATDAAPTAPRKVAAANTVYCSECNGLGYRRERVGGDNVSVSCVACKGTGRLAAPPPQKEAKRCPCSPDCTCGCVQGGPCDCARNVAPPVQVPATAYSAPLSLPPVSFSNLSGPGGGRFFGGGRRGGGGGGCGAGG